MPIQLGVDVGGTFTDVVADDGGRLTVSKVPSTPSDQAEGVAAGVRALGVDLGSAERFVHGTTVATNALLERRGARTVLVTTEGFRDVLEIGRQDRPKLYDLTARRPPPIVPQERVVETGERVTAEGEVLRSLEDPDAVAAAVAALEPEAVAVCLLFSFLHPEHEAAIERALAPLGVPVSCSSSVLPVFREYERASTTALNAYVAPVMARYLRHLVERLRADGLDRSVEVMRSGGGTFDAEQAARLPVHTLLSGPAAGAWGAAAVGAAAGFDDVIAFDMGGTSTDATLIEGGRPRTSGEGRIDGLPFAVASTEVHTVGAGGGSVAWRDEGGALAWGRGPRARCPGRPAMGSAAPSPPSPTRTRSSACWIRRSRSAGRSGSIAPPPSARSARWRRPWGWTPPRAPPGSCGWRRPRSKAPFAWSPWSRGATPGSSRCCRSVARARCIRGPWRGPWGAGRW
jgi:N-methylhydantoinase A